MTTVSDIVTSPILAQCRRPFAKVFAEVGASAVPAGGRIRPALGRLGHHVCRHYDRCARCSLDWDRRRWVTPASGFLLAHDPSGSCVRPRPRKPGSSCALGDVSPLGESRGGTPTGERARFARCRTGWCGRYYPTPVGVPLPFASVVKGRRERPPHSPGGR